MEKITNKQVSLIYLWLDNHNEEFGSQVDSINRTSVFFDIDTDLSSVIVKSYSAGVNAEDAYIKVITEYYKQDDMKMSKKESIKWLEEFIVKWDKLDDIIDTTEEFEKRSQLEYEYSEFTTQNELPEMSADELLIKLKSKNESSLKLSDLKVGDNIKFKTGFWKDIMNSGIDFGSFTGTVTRINTEASELDVELDEHVEALNEWDNKLLFGPDDNEIEYALEHIEVIPEEIIEVEKTMFNDQELFITEFKGYLIGKNVIYKDDNKKHKITDIQDAENGLGTVIIVLDGGGANDTFLESSDFQDFIDGNLINSEKGEFGLILQEEQGPIIEEKVNQPDYKYYVVNEKTRKIETGWEYKEDADDALKESELYGGKYLQISSKKNLNNMGIDPNDNSNWLQQKDDFAIIEEALSNAVSENDMDQESADIYLEKYKNEGKYTTVIKARLVYYLEVVDNKFRKSIINSTYDKALNFKEKRERIAGELLNIIKRDI